MRCHQLPKPTPGPRCFQPRRLGGSRGVVARVVLVFCHLLVICEGCCAFPGGALKATIVNCSCHWVISLMIGSYGAPEELGFGFPISHRTTKWWSTQRGRSVLASTWTSGEKLCVIFVINFLDFSRWLVFILLWLVHFSTRWYKDHIPLFYIPQTNCNKLFSVISFESLYYLC
jgi:hypothetical protein